MSLETAAVIAVCVLHLVMMFIYGLIERRSRKLISHNKTLFQNYRKLCIDYYVLAYQRAASEEERETAAGCLRTLLAFQAEFTEKAE